MTQLILMRNISNVLGFFISDLVKNLEIRLFHLKAGIQYEYKDCMGESSQIPMGKLDHPTT